MSVKIEDPLYAEIIRKVVSELDHASGLHPAHNSLHESYSIIAEELDEFWDQVKLKASKRDEKNIELELVQTAAMAIRALYDHRKRTAPKPERPVAYAMSFIGEGHGASYVMDWNTGKPVQVPPTGECFDLVSLRLLNRMSPIKFVARPQKRCYEVLAWTCDLDENGGNCKGWFPYEWVNQYEETRKLIGGYKHLANGNSVRIVKGALG